MRTMTLYANEMGIAVDADGVPVIDTATAQQYVDRYAPWAAAWEIVCGGIMAWEDADEHRRWRSQL